MRPKYGKVKVLKVVQVGNKRYVQADAAAHEYSGWVAAQFSRRWRRPNVYSAVYDKCYRRSLPIFTRLLS